MAYVFEVLEEIRDIRANKDWKAKLAFVGYWLSPYRDMCGAFGLYRLDRPFRELVVGRWHCHATPS